jgi:phosphonate transport system ATP-binding protein
VTDERPTRVAVSGLVTAFVPGRPVLAGVDLRVGDGEVVALVGANGAGKSTLLRSLVGLIPAADGEVLVDGTDVRTARRAELRDVRRRVGFVFQRLHLAPRLSVFHNALLGSLGRTGPRGWWPATASSADRAEAMDALDRVGLADLARRRLASLSGGQQQRVAIARMLVQRPRLVLADEPVASLDPAAAASVMVLLRDVATERGLPVIVALHQIDYARRFTDRIVGLNAGRVVLDQPIAGCADAAIGALYAPSAPVVDVAQEALRA